MKPRVLILRTAGINCDKETAYAFSKAGARVDLFHINFVKKSKKISSYQILCIPGGFSYGDDLGAGKIFSLEIILWFKEQISALLSKGGLILGICNGFQVLTRAGILPDLNFNQEVSLTYNDSRKFEDRWTYLKLPNEDSEVRKIWFKDLPEIIHLPVAHAEGKFYTEKAILDRIENSNQVALRYTDDTGVRAGYPYNPNGSLNNIAGITDKKARVLGLMPHPERFISKHHHPFWQKKDIYPWGLKIFTNAIDHFK